MVENNHFDNIFATEVDGFGIALKERDFRWANILANRIMSNAYIFKNKNYGIVGHVFKEIANDGLVLQQKKPDSASIIDYANFSKKVVGGIIKMIEKQEIDLNQLWELYHDQQNSTNKMFQSKIEQTIYLKENNEYSSIFIQNLLNLLEKNLFTIIEPKNNFIKGFLNEVGRLSKVQGLSLEDEQFVSLFRAIDRIDDYNKSIFQGNEYAKVTKEEILPLVCRIIEISKNRNANSKTEINNLLWELIKIWRFDFIKYLEVRTPTYSIRNEKITSEEEEDSELVNEVKKQIEKELGT